MGRGINEFDIVGLFLMPIPIVSFYLVLSSQLKHLTVGNALISIFMVRAALLIPVFGFTIFVSLLVPRLFPVMRILQSIFEAYAVWSFYAALVTNVGGASNSAHMLRDSNIPLICCRLRNECPERTYNRIKFAMWQFLWIRPWIQAIAAISSYADSARVYSVMVLIAAGSTLYMIPALITVARVLYDECYGLKVALKFLVVKVSVGLLLIEDAVQSILYSTGTVEISDDIGLDDFTEEEKFIRIYCIIALVECTLLAVLLYIGFTPAMVVSARAAKLSSQELNTDNTLSIIEYGNDDILQDVVNLSWSGYIKVLCSLRKPSCGNYLSLDNTLTRKLIENGMGLSENLPGPIVGVSTKEIDHSTIKISGPKHESV